MSVDIVLVSGERVTLAAVRERFADPDVRAVLGAARFRGSPEKFPHLTNVDTPRLSVGVYGPQESRTGEGVAPYTTDLGVVAPIDEDGSCWWAQFVIAEGIDDHPAVEALFDVLASLALSGRGHVVVQGEIVDLPGVPPPTPLPAGSEDPPVATDPPDLTAGATYLSLFLPFRAPGRAGWDRVIRLVHTLTEDVPELWPGFIRVDGEWRAFQPTREPPAWWPMEQDLGCAEPPAEWLLAPAGFPHESLTSLRLRARTDATMAERLLPVLERAEVSYGFLHQWTPAERLPDARIGLRDPGPDQPPWALVTERNLRVALPGPFWCQVIGPEWEAVVGRERLASAPAHRVQEIGPHRWLVQLTASPSDLDGIHRARDAVHAHLGAETFWARSTEKTPRVVFATSGGRSLAQLSSQWLARRLAKRLAKRLAPRPPG